MNERLEQEWKSYCDKQGTGTMISVNVKDVAEHFYNLALEDVKKEVETRKAVNEHFNLDEKVNENVHILYLIHNLIK